MGPGAAAAWLGPERWARPVGGAGGAGMPRAPPEPPCPPQTGELVALKKVPLRRPEDGIPPQTLREIKALREIEDHPHVSGPAPDLGVPRTVPP